MFTNFYEKEFIAQTREGYKMPIQTLTDREIVVPVNLEMDVGMVLAHFCEKECQR